MLPQLHDPHLLLWLQDPGAAGVTRETDRKFFSSCNVFPALLLTMLSCQLQGKNISRAQMHFHSMLRKGELGDEQQ